MTDKNSLEMTPDEQRARFEAWYVQNAFYYERDPIGSKLCGDQWTAWQACAADMQDVQMDAERYRWLKSQKTPQEILAYIVFTKDVDQAIDAAMKGESA